MYTCGPTVYNFAHIGNFRAYTFEDVLRRAIRFCGMGVKQVMNLTDVDDKTIRNANANSVALTDYTRTYKDAFFADLKALNIEPAEVYPAATDHIPEMIALVEKLMEKGVAYKSDDGSVYFNVRKFPGYGALAHIDFDNQRTGARCASDEYDKENVGDFALWKAWEESDGPVGWDSPWGRGRPGWHIECSAMAMKYLGESFDLHTGGIDNLFPHHENEIAQAEAATGAEFVKTWMHCAHLKVNGEKMSKSAGNFFTLRDLIEKGYTGREIRYVLVNAHYRTGLNFAFSALDDARKSLDRIDRAVDALTSRLDPSEAAPAFVAKALEDFTAAVSDDLNIPKAFAALFDLVRETNASESKSPAVLDAFKRMDEVLGVIFFGRKEKEEIPSSIAALLEQRAAARQAKDWALSDKLRDEIAAQGWLVKDSKEGQTCTKK
ncbi:MAG: cysteine--tRNA ligase [Kiritimatiellae bacterium]|jgi:cysteinyl-tRNA synthetase|nr:cysteine--tRNA ligase [Kiritimatiellia bacterium]